jgi:hypothetical protein
MHSKLAILFGSATILIVATSVSADPLTLTDFQLDGVTPLAQYSPADLFQLRIAIDSATDDEPDRARDAVVQEELETEGSGLASGDQSVPLAATSQSASSELTVAPEPQLASSSRNTPATWTGGKYGASSQRSVAPEPRRWSGGTYAASSQAQLASSSRNTPATRSGGTYGASSQRSVAPGPRRWSGGTFAAPSQVIPAARPTLATTSRSQLSASAGGTQRTSAVSSSPARPRVAISVPNRTWRSENLSMPRAALGSVSTDQPSRRDRSAGAAQRATVTPNLRNMVVNVRSEATRMLRGLHSADRSFSMRP